MQPVDVILLFMVKHFICDFPLQASPYMYKNKGTYMHMGGLLHAWIHAVGTCTILSIIGVPTVLYSMCVLIDFIAHYHIDYFKVKVGKIYGLKPDNSEWFWVLLGFDQLLHFLTYYIIVRYIT